MDAPMSDTAGNNSPSSPGRAPENEKERSPVVFGIQGRVALLVGALVIVTALATTIWIFQKFNQELISSKMRDLGAETALQELSFKAAARELKEDVTFLEGTPPIQGIIRSRAAGGIDPVDGSTEQAWRQRLATIFAELLKAKPDYLQVRYIGVADNGREIVRVDRYGEKRGIRVVPEAGLQEKGGREYFQNAIRNAPGQTSLSDINLNREHGEIERPVVPVLRASVPVYGGDGRVFGIIIINQDMRSVFADLKNIIRKNNRYYITNRYGDYLRHPDDDAKAFAFEFGASARFQDDFPELAGSFQTRDELEKTVIHTNPVGEAEVVSLRLVNYDPSDPSKIIGIAVSDSYADVVKISSSVKNQAYLIIAALILNALLVGLLFAQWLTKPILQITRAVREFAAGGDKPRLPVAAGAEAGVLARAFDHMINEVRDRTEELKREVAEREKAELYAKAIVDYASDAIVTINADGMILSFNLAAENMFGYREEEVTGLNVKVLMPPPYRDEHDGYLENYLRTGVKKIIGTGREVVGLGKDGREFQIELTVAEVRTEDQHIFMGAMRDISQRKEAERTLNRYRQIVDSTTDFIAFLDTAYTYRAVNENYLKAFARSEDDVIGHTHGEVVGEDYFREVSKPNLDRCLAGESLNDRRWYDYPGLGRRYVDVNSNPHYDENGVITGVVISIRDMTPYREAQQMLLRYEEIINSVSEFMAFHDTEHRFLALNKSYLAGLGKSSEEVIGHHVSEFIGNEDYEKTARPNFERALKGEEVNVEIWSDVKLFGRRFLKIKYLPYRDAGGEISGVIVSGHDVTEQKLAEDVLRRYETIINSVTDRMVFIGSDYTIRAANRSYLAAIGKTGEEVLGSNLLELFDKDYVESYMKPFLNRALSGRTEESAAWARGGDGNPVYLEISYIPYKDEHGRVRGVILVAHDITDIKHAQDELLKKNEQLKHSNQELEQFAYVASHDLQEPLRTVTSYTQLLEKRYSDRFDDAAGEFMQFIVEAAKRMQNLIDDLLAFSRVTSRARPFVPVDCGAVFDVVVEDISAAITESGSSVTRDDLPTVQGDPSQLRQLFQNLIGNAIKYRHPDRKNHIHVSARKSGKYCEFSVKDNGIGIKPEYYERIFEIFQRLHGRGEYSGTGIGLALCKKIVKMHGGRIWLESAPGEGTTFLFTLRDADYLDNY